jgi:hypothetical protein
MGLVFNTYTEHTREYFDPDEWLTEWKFSGYYPEGCQDEDIKNNPCKIESHIMKRSDNYSQGDWMVYRL